jgi:hypothetical protein
VTAAVTAREPASSAAVVLLTVAATTRRFAPAILALLDLAALFLAQRIPTTSPGQQED